VDTAVVAMNTAPLATGEPVFRFYDNRQKYLLFVYTCSEKWVVAQRVAMELGNIYPRPRGGAQQWASLPLTSSPRP
jgi:hypothetical protein